MLKKTFPQIINNRFVWLEGPESQDMATEALKQDQKSPEKNDAIKKLNELNSKLGNLDEQINTLSKKNRNADKLNYEKTQLEAEYKAHKQEIENRYQAEETKLATQVADVLREFEGKDSEKIQTGKEDVDYQKETVDKLINLDVELKNRELTPADVQMIEESINALFGQENDVVGPEEMQAMQNAITIMRTKVSEHYDQSSLDQINQERQSEYVKELEQYTNDLQNQNEIKNKITQAGEDAVNKAKDKLATEPTKYLRFIDSNYWTTNSAIEFGYNPSTEKVNIRIGEHWKETDLYRELTEKRINDSENNRKFVDQINRINSNPNMTGEQRQVELARYMQSLAKSADDCHIESESGDNLWGDTWKIGNAEAPEQIDAITAYMDKPVNLKEIRTNAEQNALSEDEKALLAKELKKPEKPEDIQPIKETNPKENLAENNPETSTESQEGREKSEYLHKNIPGTQEEFDAMIKKEFPTIGFFMKYIVKIMAERDYLKIERNENNELVMNWSGKPEIGKNEKTDLSKLDVQDIKDESLKSQAKEFLSGAQTYLEDMAKDKENIDVDKYAKNIKDALAQIKNGALNEMNENKQKDFLKGYLDRADETSFKDYLNTPKII